ncbi:MAG: hypothetical protein JKY28_02270 [Sulfurimonas sp.]|nr:hypothetical protein [Sulfurimonas sp.]PHQ89603.1 MAG: hypothetical protein COB42_06615 [Sulfurimonas sp.]
MLLFGHRFIPSDSFYHVLDSDSISNTPPSSHVHIEFDEKNLDIIEYANQNTIPFSLSVKNIREIIYAASLGASYIVVHENLAEDAHKIATEYLFDAKILVLIEEESQIEGLALLGVDGVIFSNAIIKVNS